PQLEVPFFSVTYSASDEIAIVVAVAALAAFDDLEMMTTTTTTTLIPRQTTNLPSQAIQ
ncbi:MAG: hypothetical protein ACI8RD_008790, partial [Bacillariaceae sp.]